MSENPTGARPAWYRLGIADGVFLVFAIAVLRTGHGGMLDDPGLGWHLRVIDAMREQGTWLTTDPFSMPAGRPWSAYHWLGDLLFWGSERLGGLNGLAALTALILAFTFRSLFRMLLTDGLAWPAAALWTFLAAMATRWSWTARPNLLTLPFILLTARLCERFHRNECSRRSLFWLWPVFLVWANSHSGYVAGLMMLVVTVSIEAVLSRTANDPEARRDAARRGRFLVLIAVGAFLTSLVNPYGLYCYRYTWQQMGNPFFMNLHEEWQSPDFHSGGAFSFELLILLFPALLVFSRRRPDLVALALSLIWLHFALNASRFVALWALVAVPTLARASADVPWLGRQLGRLPLSADMRQLLGPRPGPQPFGGTILVTLALAALAHWGPNYAGHGPTVPQAALERVLVLNTNHAPVFHDYGWGGYLVWHGWPRFHTWIDDRNELHTQEHVLEYFSLIQTDPGWEQKLQDYKFELICIKPRSPLARRLAESTRWKEVYRDEDAVIFQPSHQGGTDGK